MQNVLVLSSYIWYMPWRIIIISTLEQNKLTLTCTWAISRYSRLSSSVANASSAVNVLWLWTTTFAFWNCTQNSVFVWRTVATSTVSILPGFLDNNGPWNAITANKSRNISGHLTFLFVSQLNKEPFYACSERFSLLSNTSDQVGSNHHVKNVSAPVGPAGNYVYKKWANINNKHIQIPYKHIHLITSNMKKKTTNVS